MQHDVQQCLLAEIKFKWARMVTSFAGKVRFRWTMMVTSFAGKAKLKWTRIVTFVLQTQVVQMKHDMKQSFKKKNFPWRQEKCSFLHRIILLCLENLPLLLTILSVFPW